MIRFIFLISLLVFWPQATHAGFLDNLACISDGDCQLDDVVLGVVYLIRLMLGGMGAVALVYFVIGGLQWLTSGGSPEKVKKGRDIITNTIFALVVAFSSYIILDFFVNNLLGVKEGYSGIKSEEITGCTDPRSEGMACGLPEINMVCYTTQGENGAKRECKDQCYVYSQTTKEPWECQEIDTSDPAYVEGVNFI